MKLCSLCNQYFDDIQGICPNDRTPLETVENDRLIGALICDRYVIDSVIGKGASGVVYKARRIQRGDIVAIKVLHNHLGAEGNSLDRFLREAIAASKLRNPHIITIWDSGVTDDGQPFFVMDYLEGITLGRLIKTTSQIPFSRVLSIIKQVTDALGEAHKQGIVHRDLKPENIILQVTDAGEDFVKLLDFGVSDLPADSPRVDKPKSVAGSPAYMSPEQCQGFQLDARSDIYSLGIVVFEMLTGRRPFRVDDHVSLMFLHVSEPPMKLAEARPEINYPPALQAAISKALAKVTSQRQASVEEFYQELGAALGIEQIESSPQALSDTPGHFSFAGDERLASSAGADNGQQNYQSESENDSLAKTDTADIEPISVAQTELSLGAGSTNLMPPSGQSMPVPATPPNATPKSNLRNVFKDQIIEEEQQKAKPKPKSKSTISGLASPFKAMAMATQTLVGFAVPALKPGRKESTETGAPPAEVVDPANALIEMPLPEAASDQEVAKDKSKNPSKHSLPAMGLNGLLSVLESRPATPPPVPEAGGPKSLSDLLKNGRRTGSNAAVPAGKAGTQSPADSATAQSGFAPPASPASYEVQQATTAVSRNEVFGNNPITQPASPSAPAIPEGNGQTQRPVKNPFTTTKHDMLAPQRIEARREEAPANLPGASPPTIEPYTVEQLDAIPLRIPVEPISKNVSSEPIESFEIPNIASESKIQEQILDLKPEQPAELPVRDEPMEFEPTPVAEPVPESTLPIADQTDPQLEPLNKLTTTGGQQKKLVRQSQANPPLSAPAAKGEVRGAAVSPEIQKRTQEMVVNSLNSLSSQYQQKNAGDNAAVKQSGSYGVRQSGSFPKPSAASPVKQSGAFPKENPVRQSGSIPKPGGASPVRQSGSFSVRQSGSFVPAPEQRFLAAAPYSPTSPSGQGSIARMVDEVDLAPEAAPVVEVNAGTVVFEHDPASLQDLGAAAWGHFASGEGEAKSEEAPALGNTPATTTDSTSAGAYFNEDVAQAFMKQPEAAHPTAQPPIPATAFSQIEPAKESPPANSLAPVATPQTQPARSVAASPPSAAAKPQVAVSPIPQMEPNRTNQSQASDIRTAKAAGQEPVAKPNKPLDIRPDESISDMLIALSVDHDPAALEQPPLLLESEQADEGVQVGVPEALANQSLSQAAAATRAAQSDTTPELMQKPRKSPFVTIGQSDASASNAQARSEAEAIPPKENLKDLLSFESDKAPAAKAPPAPEPQHMREVIRPAPAPPPRPAAEPVVPAKPPQVAKPVKPPEVPKPQPIEAAKPAETISPEQPGLEAVTATDIPQSQPSPQVAKSLELMPKTPESLIDFFKEEPFKPLEPGKQPPSANREPTPRELFAYEPNRVQAAQTPASPPADPTPSGPGDLAQLLDSLELAGKEKQAKPLGTPKDLPSLGLGKAPEVKQPAAKFDEVTLQEAPQQTTFELTRGQEIQHESESFAPKVQEQGAVTEAKAAAKNNSGPAVNRLIEAAKRGPTSSKIQKPAPANPGNAANPAPELSPGRIEAPRQPVDPNAGMFSQSASNSQAPLQNISQSMTKSGNQSRSVREMMEAGSSIKQEITGGFNRFSAGGEGDNIAQSVAALAGSISPETNRPAPSNPAKQGKDVGGISLILPPPAELMSLEPPLRSKPDQPVYTDADYENMDSAQASNVVKQKYEAQLARKKEKSTSAWTEAVTNNKNRTASLRTRPGGMNFAHTVLIGAITLSFVYACVSVVMHMTTANKAFAPAPVKPIKTLLQNKDYEQVRKILEKKQETATLTKQDADDLDTAYVNIAKEGVKAKKYEVAMTVAQKIGPKSSRFNEAAKLLRQIKRLKRAQGKRSSG
ncbi:MAG: hypothetical protein C5B53_06695 [Candidatus Melainabacteria bacterium]|nr:MAG: hypothetical protein C5B53_06695 [Candidatus Melainabacteria bacterium]